MKQLFPIDVDVWLMNGEKNDTCGSTACYTVTLLMRKGRIKVISLNMKHIINVKLRNIKRLNWGV